MACLWHPARQSKCSKVNVWELGQCLQASPKDKPKQETDEEDLQKVKSTQVKISKNHNIVL